LPRSPRIAHGSLRDHSLSRRSTTNLLIFLISAGVNARPGRRACAGFFCEKFFGDMNSRHEYRY
jgi:hypothetical protein